MRYSFKPNLKIVGAFYGKASVQDLSEEVGVYSASPEFVREHCGPIAKSMLDAVPQWYYEEARELGLYPNVDVRIHRLYPGNFPAYPGWHCDGEYRETYFAQPDMHKIKVHHHLTGTVSTEDVGISCTEFLIEPVECDIAGSDSENTFWGQVDASVNEKVRRFCFIPDGNLALFDSWTLHRCAPARSRGWRLFFRMSMWHKPYLGREGKISKQEQVYLVKEGVGW